MRYNCDMCQFNTDNKSNYNKHCATKKHIRNLGLVSTCLVVHKKNNLNCEYCDSCYSSKSNLNKHKKKFHSEHSSVGTDCSSETENEDSLFTNRTDNTIDRYEKIYRCKYCNKRLSRLDNLKRHESRCGKSEVYTLKIKLKQEKNKRKSLEKEIEMYKRLLTQNGVEF